MAAAVAKEFGPKGTDGKPTTADDGSIPPSLAKLLPGNSPEPESPWTQANTIQGFLAGLLLRTAVMTLVLKGAFMYKDFPIIWREVVVVAAGVAFTDIEVTGAEKGLILLLEEGASGGTSSTKSDR